MNNFANAAREHLNREAAEQALKAAASQGEPRITAEALELARRRYRQHLEMAQLVREKRAQPELALDGRRARIREIIDSGELDRLDYEHTRDMYRAQGQGAAERANRRLAVANFFVAFAVMAAVFVQAWAAFRK